jgi:hypothetical protein
MQQPLREIDLLWASALKEIWTKEKAEYHGEFVNFDPMIARPKPVQKPHPPIHVGGAFPHGARRHPLLQWLDSRWRYPRGPDEIPRHGAGGWSRSGFEAFRYTKTKDGATIMLPHMHRPGQPAAGYGGGRQLFQRRGRHARQSCLCRRILRLHIGGRQK